MQLGDFKKNNLNQFTFMAKLRKVQRYLHSSAPPPILCPFPHCLHPTPKWSLNCARAHSWGCTFHEFGETYDVMGLPCVIQDSSHCPKILYALSLRHSSTLPLDPLTFSCLQIFAFSRMLESWNPAECSPFRLASFT
jgi:hypothetical protein